MFTNRRPSHSWSRSRFRRESGKALIARTGPWGVKVERVEMKNVEIPTSMQRAIAQEAEALREERARLKQLESAERLRRASEIIMGNASRFSANHWRLGDSTDAPDKEGCRERANHAEIKNNSKAWTDRPASGQRIVECPRPWSADGIGASGHVNRAGRPETPGCSRDPQSRCGEDRRGVAAMPADAAGAGHQRPEHSCAPGAGVVSRCGVPAAMGFAH
jgi:hypothetical protein